MKRWILTVLLVLGVLLTVSAPALAIDRPILPTVDVQSAKTLR
ncbi:MAG TPA: hypothetical protein VNT75_06455 [Symbiobacteriaceae bacterium]|nr:hypothetical protein [Symbiobacteriaceae bacterium]